jgi:phage-related tail protein
MASGGEVVGGSGPVVVGENGPEIVRLKKGNSVTPNSQLNTVGNNNKETNDLLRQILAKVDQPAIIKMGDTTINELGNKINLNRNYSAS